MWLLYCCVFLFGEKVWMKILKTERCCFWVFVAQTGFSDPGWMTPPVPQALWAAWERKLIPVWGKITLTDIMAEAGCNICGCCFFHSPSKASKGSAAEEKAPEVSECQTLRLFTLQIKAISRLGEPIYSLWFVSRYYVTCVSNPVAGPAVLMARGGRIF